MAWPEPARNLMTSRHCVHDTAANLNLEPTPEMSPTATLLEYSHTNFRPIFTLHGGHCHLSRSVSANQK